MGQKTGTIHIKWVRSAIALPRQQKEIVSSLGLSHLNQVVERPDTPNVRGIVAKVPHLLQVVPAPAKPAWASVPEYVITAPPALPEGSKKPKAKAKAETVKGSDALEEKAGRAPSAEAQPAKAEKAAPRKKAAAEKKTAAAPAKRAAAKSEGEKPRKRKAAESKEAKPKKKGTK